MNDRTLLRVSVTVASICVVLSLVLFSLLADVLLMEVTNDPDVFLSELDELGWQNVRWSLLIDLAFPILYVLLSLLAVDAAARIYQQEWLRSIGPRLRTVAIVAGVCDIFENVFLLIAIGSGPAPPDQVATVPLYLSSLFSYLKWIGLLVVVVYAAPGLIVGAWRAITRRSAGS